MSEEKPRKVPRVVSCLVKGPLGCLAFLLGVLVILVLFLPSALGRWADHSLESWFAKRHEGTLQLTDVWLGSLYAEQRIESLILRDPVGDEVLRASLRAPALWDFIGEDDVRYGPVEIDVKNLRLVEQEGGTLNLARAWSERESEFDAFERRDDGLRTDVPVIVDLLLRVERLRLLERGGSEIVLADLELHGSLELNNDDLRLALAGGSLARGAEALHVELALERNEGRTGVAWKHSFTVHSLPTGLARHLVRPHLPLDGAGPVLDALSFSRQGKHVELKLSDQDASFSLEGKVSDDGLALEGDDDKRAELAFTFQSACAADALATLLPFVTRLEPASEDAKVRVRLEDYRWPLEGGWHGLSGELELDLGPARFELEPTLQARLDEAGLRFTAADLEQKLRLTDGFVELQDFRLPLESGWLELDGTFDVASRHCELALRAEVAGEMQELGVWQNGFPALTPHPPLPPDVPGETAGELPDKGDIDAPEESSEESTEGTTEGG